MDNKEEIRKTLERIKELTRHGKHREAQALYDEKLKNRDNH